MWSPSASTGCPTCSEGFSGAPVLTSIAMIRTDGFSALTTLAIPQQSPPPPHGTRIVSTSGRSSRISSPITAFPAITSGSE